MNSLINNKEYHVMVERAGRLYKAVWSLQKTIALHVQHVI